MRVVLIGYRGSGKSAVGKTMAHQLGLAFVDADMEIENRAGRSISTIFAEDGEAEFRRLEREVIAELSNGDAVIIAAGGGAVLDPETRAQWKQAGTTVIWLTATPQELANRIARDTTTSDRRPALTSDGVLEEITTVLAQRLDLYHDCQTLTIDTTGRTIEEVAAAGVDAVNSD
ncbi:MAG: shikimate kinase, partial [Planctomycetota bacterium]|nr:shikimate kinase [Planctomycetota bacterium]